MGLLAAPTLLADVLGRAVAGRGLEVVRLFPTRTIPAAEGEPGELLTRIDVAVVCGDVPEEEIPADVVVRLPEGDLGAAGGATEVLVTGSHSQASVEVADLEGLVELVVKLTADR